MKFLQGFLALAGVALVSGRSCPPRSNYPTFSGNISFDGHDVTYSYRESDAFTLSVPGSGGMGAYSSTAAFKDPTSAEFDAFAARLAADTFHPPTASTAWFSSSSSLIVNASQAGINGNVYAGVFNSAMSTVFLEVIEFEDVNGDGVYDPDTDVKVQSLRLQKQRWDTMCSSASSSSSSSSGIVAFNISTLPSLPSFDIHHRPHYAPYLNFSIQGTLSDVVGVTDSNVLLTPRSMKIDVQLNDFPYIGYNNNGTITNTTKLALAAVVASAQLNASVNVDYDGRRIRSGDGNAQFTLDWVAQARASGRDVNVKSSGFADFVDVDGSLGLALDLFFDAKLAGSVSLKKIYFAFDATQPSSVYWDPTIVSGAVLTPPSSSSSSSSDAALSSGAIAGVTIGVVLGVILLVLVVVAVYRFNKKSSASSTTVRENKKAETEALVDNSAYQRVNEI